MTESPGRMPGRGFRVHKRLDLPLLLGDNPEMHHPGWVVLLVGGSTFGWIFKRMKYAWEDHIGAKIRLRNAKRERRRAALWALAFGVAGLFILHVLL